MLFKLLLLIFKLYLFYTMGLEKQTKKGKREASLNP